MPASSGLTQTGVDRVRSRDTERPYLVLALGLFSIALALFVSWLLNWSMSAPVALGWWGVVLIAGAFVFGEQLTLHVEYRRDALTITLTEVPAALAMVFLSLPEALVARLVCGVVVLAIIVRQPPVKLGFSLCAQAASLCVGYTVLGALQGGSEWSQVTFLWVLIAMLSMAAVDVVLVIAAIGLNEGRFWTKLRDVLRSGSPRIFIAAATATIAAGLAAAWPVLPFFLVFPILGVWSVLRSNARTSQHLRDLLAANGLMTSLGESIDLHELARIAATETQRLLRAGRVVLLSIDPDSTGPAVLATRGGPIRGLPERIDDPSWAWTLSHPEAQLVEAGRLGIDAVGRFAVVAPVHTDGNAVALLIAVDRVGAEDDFAEAERVRATTIAQRLSLALRNALLVARIEHEAMHDSLTGLANRALFERRLDQVLADGDPVGRVGVLMLGVDRFREVNSTLGHQVGDRVLVELVARVEAALPPGGMLARLAGDEFGVLVELDGTQDLMAIAREVSRAVERRFTIDEFEVVVTLSVGAVECREVATTAARMLRRADIAMHSAKEQHSSVELYRDEIDRRTPERLSLLGDLKTALEHGHLDVHFQPKVDLSTGRIVGAEALVRWQHPQRGFVPPVEFVQLAENTGLITTLTDQVLRKSVAALRLLNDLGFRLEVSLNLSTIDLLDELLVGRVERILADNGVPPDQLTLEITETALLADGQRSLATAEGLRRLGAHLSIDDFGTGFSSFSYLRVLPASELKVDRSFVLKLLDDERDEVIVRSTIDLGHNLGLRVVAEGVEDMATLERLRLLGCDLAQGYGIAKPMPLDRLLVFLNSGGYEPNRVVAQPPPLISVPTAPFTPRIVSA